MRITFYPSTSNGWQIKNFSAWEFLCPCCKLEFMDLAPFGFMNRLQIARTIAGISFVIGSGWRCLRRNMAVGGVKDSSHLTGHAADIIVTTSEQRYVVLNSVIAAGFVRIGIAKFYIHVDDDPTKAQRVIWTY